MTVIQSTTQRCTEPSEKPGSGAQPAPSPAMAGAQLNEGQSTAVDGILNWLQDPHGSPTALLSGEAGTGKTFCLKQVGLRFRGRIVFTAPTNKATKVLRQTLRDEHSSPITKTIYSLLGLQLKPNGEVRELTAPEEEIDLSKYALVVVDEGSMVNQLLMGYIQEAISRYKGLRFLFVGDSAQLPPVGERLSPIWDIKPRWDLTEQMRNAGPILALAKDLRKQQSVPAPRFAPQPVVHEVGQVSVLGTADFEARVREAARSGAFGQTNGTKIVCWRNATVDNFNRMVRRELFDTPQIPWLPTDRIILTAPAKDIIEDEPMATTDDEGLIDRADIVEHPLHPELTVWRLSVTTDDNKLIKLFVLHSDSERAFLMKSEDLAAKARANPRLWGKFWEFKEAFHDVRHAYAITAHRAQGSTYESAFVNWRDILINRDRVEAYKCLYVAATRAKKHLILG